MILLPHIDWNSWLSGLIGAVVGGVIAAVSTMWAASRSAKQAFHYSRSLQAEADRETLRRLLSTIRTEIRTTWDAYQSEAGRHIDPSDHQPLHVRYDLKQQYFSVYDSNAQFLGIIENDNLRAAIVRTYTLFKRLIDLHVMNNDLREAHNEALKSRGADPHGYTWRQFDPAVQRAMEECK
jgi:gas vesicle protein